MRGRRFYGVTEPCLAGGGQEMGLRAGTENVMLITALGKAAEVVHVELQDLHRHMQVGRIPLRHTHMHVGTGGRIPLDRLDFCGAHSLLPTYYLISRTLCGNRNVPIYYERNSPLASTL